MRHGDVDPCIIVFCQSTIETMIHPLFYYKFFIYYKYKCWLLLSICQLDTSSLISHFSHVNRREIAGSSITQYAYSCYSYYLDVRLPSHILALPYTFLIVDLTYQAGASTSASVECPCNRSLRSISIEKQTISRHASLIDISLEQSTANSLSALHAVHNHLQLGRLQNSIDL